MQPKNFLLCVFILLIISPAIAQDRIYTHNGGMYEVKIKEIGTKTILYKKWNNQEGPDYVMPKNEAERIRFQNGDEERFDKHTSSRPVREHRGSTGYGKNIIGLSPLHMTNASAIGFGLSYERILDRNSIFSFYLPVVYSFKDNDEFYNYNTTTYEKDKNRMVWFYPGVKIYPTGSNGIVRYSVGPMLAFGTGGREYTRNVYDPVTQTNSSKRFNENVTVMGFMVNNSLNVQPSPKVHIGLELGLGIPYYSSRNNTNANYAYYNDFSDEPLVQFNFNVGYRF